MIVFETIITLKKKSTIKIRFETINFRIFLFNHPFLEELLSFLI
jgi:hypothetical protein